MLREIVVSNIIQLRAGSVKCWNIYRPLVTCMPGVFRKLIQSYSLI